MQDDKGYLDELENLRKKINKKKLISYFVFVVIVIVGLLCKIGLINCLFFGFIIFAIVETILTQKDKSVFKKVYKENIVLKIFEGVFSDVNYDLERGIPREVIYSTKMMDTGDRFFSNDYVKAKYKNINFEFSDVLIQEEQTDSDGDTTYVTIFEGQWFIFDFNKKFKSNIQICEKGFRGARRGGLFEYSNYKEVKLEDEAFNQMFRTFAIDEHNCFYVLTPSVMEKIKRLNDDINGKLLFCFVDNKLHVGLNNNRDLFEPSLKRKIDESKEKEEILGEIKIITDFVDVLDLDNNLFKGVN